MHVHIGAMEFFGVFVPQLILATLLLKLLAIRLANTPLGKALAFLAF